MCIISQNTAQNTQQLAVDGYPHEAHACALLTAAHVHTAPGWSRACACTDVETAAWGEHADELEEEEEEEESLPPLFPPTDWPTALAALPATTTRHLEPLRLHGVATALAALAAVSHREALVPGQSFNLHVLGPRREIDEWALWAAFLTSWLPAHTLIHLAFVGPDVPLSLHGRRGGRGRVGVSFTRGLWHTVSSDLPPPHVGVALDAGIAAYPSWGPTLAAWTASPVFRPLTVTEHCEEAALRAGDAARGIVPPSAVVSGPTLNPFRCPLACRVPGARLPAACGAFVVRIEGGRKK